MILGNLIEFTYEFAYFLGVFILFATLAILKGRQIIMNIIVGMYLALLIAIHFPNYDLLFGSIESVKTMAIAKLLFFIFITLFTTALANRIMHTRFREKRFDSLGKKLFLALGATILIMIFSFHALPVAEFLNPGTPLQSLFGPDLYFFWWLLVPLVILYIV